MLNKPSGKDLEGRIFEMECRKCGKVTKHYGNGYLLDPKMKDVYEMLFGKYEYNLFKDEFLVTCLECKNSYSINPMYDMVIIHKFYPKNKKNKG